jgi:prepilin-type N-terminal cleavage/methylation domain-containing protein
MAIFGAGREDNGIKGFSLIEILTVLAIIGILLTIANSMFSAFRQRTNLREAAGALAEDMKLAKQRAGAENVKYSITFNISSNNYTMNQYDLNGNMINPPIKTVNLSSFGNGIIILNQNYSGGNSGTITFQTRGTCSAGTITLQNSLNSIMTITTNLMGRVIIN